VLVEATGQLRPNEKRRLDLAQQEQLQQQGLPTVKYLADKLNSHIFPAS